MILRFGQSESNQKIKSRCLVITGSKDKVVKKEESVYLLRLIKNSIHTQILNAGHAPYFETPAQFNKIIYDFIINK